MPHLRICDPLPQFPLSPDEKERPQAALEVAREVSLTFTPLGRQSRIRTGDGIPSPLLRNSIKYLGGILMGFSPSGCVISSPLVVGTLVAGLLRRMHLVILRLWPLIKAIEVAPRADFDEMTAPIKATDGIAAIFFSSHCSQFQTLLQTALTLPCHNRV